MIQLPWHTAPFRTTKGQPVVLKVRYSPLDQSYAVMMTDFRDLWLEEIAGEDALMEKIRQLNPNVEADLTPLMEHIVDVIVGRSLSTIHVTEEVNPRDDVKVSTNDVMAGSADSVGSSGPSTSRHHSQMCVVFRSKLGRAPFKWDVVGQRMEPEMCTKELVEPLVMQCILARRRELELMELLRQKDEEIGAYRQSGIKLARKSIETKVFNAAIWEQKQELPQDIISLASSTAVDAPLDGLAQLLTSADCGSRLEMVGSLVVKAVGTTEQPAAPGAVMETDQTDVCPRRPAQSPVKSGGAPGACDEESGPDISIEKEAELRRMKAQAEAERVAKRKRKGPRF